MRYQAYVVTKTIFGVPYRYNVAARLVDPPPPPPSTKTFGLNSVGPGAPLGGLAQDLGGFD